MLTLYTHKVDYSLCLILWSYLAQILLFPLQLFSSCLPLWSIPHSNSTKAQLSVEFYTICGCSFLLVIIETCTISCIVISKNKPLANTDLFLWAQILLQRSCGIPWCWLVVVMGAEEEAVVLSWILERSQNWAPAALQSQHFLELGQPWHWAQRADVWASSACCPCSLIGFYMGWVSVLQSHLDLKAFVLASYSGTPAPKF